MSINVNPAKIISGLEPERTRHLLQLFTVVATTKCLVPTDKRSDLSMRQEAPPKSDPQMEEETRECETVGENDEVQNASPTIVESGRSSLADIDNSSSSKDIDAQSKVLEDIRIKSSLVYTNERPATSHGDRQSSVNTGRNDRPINVMRPATAMTKGSKYMSGLEETNADVNDLSIFHKSIQEQQLKENATEE